MEGAGDVLIGDAEHLAGMLFDSCNAGELEIVLRICDDWDVLVELEKLKKKRDENADATLLR